MKLLRYGPAGSERPAILDGSGQMRDLSGVVADIDRTTLAPDMMAKLAALDVESLPKVDGTPRIGSAVARPGKFLCVGLNYADHARETGKEPPAEPVLFSKATTALCGPNDDVEIPRGSDRTDWEIELGIVIGSRAKYVSEDDALDYVAGYTLINDVSERRFQSERGGQWVKGKSHDTFGPVGPWMVSKDEIADVQNIDLWLDVDGERRQTGNTKTMIFGVAHLVHYISQFMTLEAGDIIATGTPPGVGLGMKPPTFLKEGQVVTLGASGLGEQRQLMVQA
ncbi:2-keto-4-pentenoate hydratase/2-oxohepta-3-ene-1,7-dioic acid hydratase in catechol pathway [Loktanella ponticola]|uniref:2-keto-4-pentenoate hydratase/2-oxohepta-3-ene-1,7-dioic acid hydratase in catechol pathway n=1 Tax=Yoonia ponticola TaxID=1524255 RepID=A0A7W9EYU9_9RHOB|nr:fumarylacetoacetate hydrolase family protein [Yoonia ponticola]MBB5721510.1 2-keto-4-pentenoate hydratase/2-oxohepta-3-ene-1,7-dioic acid hydratase in catechol pathway [Yoonia ponticola]